MAPGADRSFQPAYQAIDGNENSDSDVHPQQRDEHQQRHRGSYYLRFQQKNDRANETGERSGDASDKLERSIPCHGLCGFSR